MQFEPDIEKCLRNPFLVRKLSQKRKAEVLDFLHQFRLRWHEYRESCFQGGKLWLKRRGLSHNG